LSASETALYGRGGEGEMASGAMRITIDQLLADARRRLQRLDPLAALDAIRAGATLIDIRTDAQIARDGTIPGARVISRNVLEWRLDPASECRSPDGPQLDDPVIVVCDEGYQSSLAAATLQQLGFARATDLAGGFQAWRAAGLPVRPSTRLTTNGAATAKRRGGKE
jgi:rhodanese-related sulfurtransferase